MERRPLKFQPGEKVYLKIAPRKGVMRFGKRNKLSPRYIRPHEKLEKVGTLTYQLTLSSSLSRVHNVFHVSQLQKYVPNPSHMVEDQPIEVKENLSIEEVQLRIVNRKDQVPRRRTIPYIKV